MNDGTYTVVGIIALVALIGLGRLGYDLWRCFHTIFAVAGMDDDKSLPLIDADKLSKATQVAEEYLKRNGNK